jgi:hypothetical protein
MLRQLINDHREQQHHQADNDDPTATGALLFQPEAQHQAPIASSEQASKARLLMIASSQA